MVFAGGATCISTSPPSLALRSPSTSIVSAALRLHERVSPLFRVRLCRRDNLASCIRRRSSIDLVYVSSRGVDVKRCTLLVAVDQRLLRRVRKRHIDLVVKDGRS